MNKYLGFTPMNPQDSALSYKNPEYLFIGYQEGRYHFEEITPPDNVISGLGDLLSLHPMARI
jgi:hypothetical protein